MAQNTTMDKTNRLIYKTSNGEQLELIVTHDGYVSPPKIVTTAPGGDAKTYWYDGMADEEAPE